MNDTDVPRLTGRLSVGLLLKNFRWRILVTWLLVVIENLLLALIPLFIGRAIDALLQGQSGALLEIGVVMGLLVLIASGRRAYDTRAYGTMRVRFGAELAQRSQAQPVSKINARLDMSRELVDFLEMHVPELLTALMQVVVSIAILWTFDIQLGYSAVALVSGLLLVYAMFHGRFYRLNGSLNAQAEQQVAILDERKPANLLAHLRKLRGWEVRLSDTEAFLYGMIFIGMFAFILINLTLAAGIDAVTAGVIFAILSYSWQLVESGIALPVTMQHWSRLSEIRERLNDHAA